MATVVTLNVSVHKRDKFSSNPDGWMAICDDNPVLYAYGDTIELAIADFQTQYGDLCKLQFANGGKLQFAFQIKVATI